MTLEDFKNNVKTKYLAETYEAMIIELADAREIFDSVKDSEKSDDIEMKEMAQHDINRLEAESKKMYDEMSAILKTEKEEESKPKAVIIEIQGGAGGDESTLFQLSWLSLIRSMQVRIS